MKKCMVLVAAMMMIAGMVSAQEVEGFESAEIADSLIANVDTVEVDPDPEWYVAPLNYDSVMARRNAPRRAAANCPIDSVLTFDEDSVLTEVAIYEHGDTTRTIVWTVNTDGSRIGQSWHEEASTANSSYTADYEWDEVSSKWAGANREENTFNSANKNISRTIYTWINHAWVPNTRYKYDYDSSNREIEFTTFTRNTSTNELVYSKQRLREFNSAGQKTLEINYDTYSNGAWQAGNKTINAYDAKGNTIEKTYYSAYTGGVWGGSASTHEVWDFLPNTSTNTSHVKQILSNNGWSNSSKEIWEFKGPNSKQTLHEQYTWSNEDWAITVSDTLRYDALGNKVLDAKYTISNGVWKGKSKTEYTFSGTTSTGNITYKWVQAKGVFDPNVWTVKNNYLGDTIENCKYSWKNNAWEGNGNRTLSYTAGGQTDLITQTWSTKSANWVNYTLKTTIKSGGKTTKELSFIWYQEGLEWIGSSRSDWHYNAAGLNDTIKTYTNNGIEWIYSKRTIKTYSGSTVIMTHISNWDVSQSKWVLESMTKTDIVDKTIDGIRQTLNASWQCGADSVWVGIQKDTSVYSATGYLLMSINYKAWANSDWVPSTKLEYQYDEANRKTVEQTFDWKNNAWVGKIRNEYHFDEQGREYIIASYVGWDNAINDWKGSTKTERTFYPNNKEATSILYGWNSNSSSWTYSYRYSYTYDNSARETEQIVEYYTNGSWQNRERYIKEYKGNLTVKDNSYVWLNNQWIFWLRDESYYDEDAQSKLRREIKGSWSNGVKSSFADNHYFYACDPRFYTIRFEDYDGTLLESKEVEGNQTPVYEGEKPSRPADAQYTYSFKGWTPAITAVTGNVTYTAVYDSIVNRYRITWLNADSTLIAVDSLEYGATPSHEEVKKTNTAEWTYSFEGWSPVIATVTKDATYKAQLDSVRNTYRVTFKNGADTLQNTMLAYGAMPEYNGDEPSKQGDAQYSYTFNGWDAELVSVTGEATYNATFNSTVNNYLVTFKNGADTLQSTMLAYGAMPEYTGNEPSKQGDAQYSYTFNGWDAELVSVTGEATYNATFSSTINNYRITFKNGEDTLQSTLVAYGAMPEYNGDEPSKQGDAQYSYTFNGWDAELVSVTGEATYNATFNSNVNNYLVTFKNGTDTLQSTMLAYGAMPEYNGAEPSKQGDAQYSYTFNGWDAELVSVTGEATYNATFNSNVNNYLVTFKNGADTLQSTLVAYGSMPVYEGDEPTKQGDAQYTYSFNGWDAELVAVTGEVTYNATFSSTINNYRITFKNGEDTLQSTLVAYGTMPVYGGETPTKQADAQYTYSFNGWDAELVAVTGETTYNATFSSTVNNYTITWLLDDGTKIDEQSVAYGTTPSHTDAHKDNTAQYTITFVGWDKAFAAVTGDETYIAVFDSVVNSYTVIFYYEDGVTVLDSKEWKYGETPSTSLIPSLPATAKYTYTFAGWSPELQPVTGNAAYTPIFDSIVNTYTVTFVNYNDMVLQSSQVPYDDVPEYTGETPIKPSNVMYHYVFTGWTPEIVAVTGDARYKAVYDQVLNRYTIIFYDEDGLTVLDSVEVEYGQMPETSVIPTKADDEEYTYTFAGWSPKIVSATRNTSYTATYTATRKTEGLWDVEAAEKAQKVMIDGVIYIRRGGKIYTLDGTEVE